MAKKLTKNQLEYVESNDKLSLVLACPGSGKTEVLVSKISRLYKNGENLNRILAITFTNKAAGEMRKRIKEETGVTKTRDIKYVSTFHAFGKKIINKYNFELKIKKNPEIISEDEKKNIARKILENAGINNQSISNIYIKPEDLIEVVSLKKNFIDINNKKYFWFTDKLFKDYNEELRIRDKIDTDDLLYLSYKVLLENKEALIELSKKFDYIFVDEYQDVNNIQYNFLKLFEDSGVSCSYVGDDDQSIYQFRGSEPKYIIDLSNNAKFKKFTLNTNFRSDEPIVELANKYIGIMDKKGKRADKGLMIAEHKGGSKPIVKLFKENKHEEIEYICDQIDILVKNYSVDPSQIAVLSRYGKEFNGINELENIKRVLLNKYGIKSSEIISEENGKKDIQTTLFKVCKILKAFSNGIEDLAVIYGQFNTPIVSNDNYAEICSIINEKFNLNVDPKNYNEFFDLFLENKNIDNYIFEDKKLNIEKHKYVSIYRFVKQETEKVKKGCNLSVIIDDLIYFSIKEGIGLDKPSNSLYSFKYFAINYEDSNINGQSQYSDTLEYLESCYLNDDLVIEDGKVNLLTVHKSKGLQFDIVFVMGLEPGNFPSSMDTSIEAERRLFYVAITRAKHLLYLTTTSTLDDTTIENANIESFVSSFLKEYGENQEIDLSKIDTNENNKIFYSQMLEKEGKIVELTQKIENLTSDYEERINSINILKGNLERQVAENNVNKDEVNDLSLQLETQIKKYNKLIEENKEIKKQNILLNNLNAEYKTKNVELKSKIEDKIKIADQTKLEIKDLKKKVLDIENEFNSAKLENKNLKKSFRETMSSLWGEHCAEINQDDRSIVEKTLVLLEKFDKSVIIHNKEKLQNEILYKYKHSIRYLSDIIYNLDKDISNEELINIINRNGAISSEIKTILQTFAYYIFNKKETSSIYKFSEIENEKSSLLSILIQYNFDFSILFNNCNKFNDVIILMNVLDKYARHRDDKKPLYQNQKENIDKFLNGTVEYKKQIFMSFYYIIFCFLSCKESEKFINDVINF